MENTIEKQVLDGITEIKAAQTSFVKKEEIKDMATKADISDLATKSAVDAIQTTVNELNEKAGQLALNQGKVKSTVAAMRDGIAANIDQKSMKVKEFAVPFNTKAAGTMTAADDLDGDTQITYRSQLVAQPYRNVHMRDLAAIIPSQTGTFSWYRQVTGEGAIAFQTSHGTKKSIINAKFKQETVTAEYLAGLAPVAKQMMQDLPFLQGYMPTFMLNEYLTQEDTEFFADLTTAATGDDTTTGLYTIEQLMQWVTNLRVANYVPDGIVMNPADVYTIFIRKDDENGYGLPPGVVISNSGMISIFGVPVFTSTFVDAGEAVVGDWSKVGIVQVDGLTVQTDDRGDNFDNNTVTFKAEARVALAVLDPNAFVHGTFSVSV